MSSWVPTPARRMVVGLGVGVGGDRDLEVIGSSVREDERIVHVTVRIRRGFGIRPSLGVHVPVAVLLTSPLGERDVVSPGSPPARDLGLYQLPDAP